MSFTFHRSTGCGERIGVAYNLGGCSGIKRCVMSGGECCKCRCKSTRESDLFKIPCEWHLMEDPMPHHARLQNAAGRAVADGHRRPPTKPHHRRANHKCWKTIWRGCDSISGRMSRESKPTVALIWLLAVTTAFPLFSEEFSAKVFDGLGRPVPDANYVAFEKQCRLFWLVILKKRTPGPSRCRTTRIDFH